MDLERFRLRRFLESLGPEELQKIETPVALADVAGVLEGNAKAVWFDRAGAEGASLAGNVAGSRSRLAKAFGTTPQRPAAGVRPE
jgi:3-polyprenyl-4-hydroxybenzoate decarboxylase